MAKSKAAENPSPPKKKGAVRRARRRAVKALRRNPVGDGGMGTEVLGTLKTVGVGAAAYGGTRFVQRIAWTVTAKRRPRWAKHAHALAGVVAFGAALLAGRKIKAAAPYYETVLVGAGAAAAQGVVAAYVPKYAWLMGDCRLEELPGAAAQNPQQLTETDPEAAGDYLEQQLAEYERGGTQRRSAKPVAAALQTASAAAGETGIDESLLEELGGGEEIDDLYGGVFEDPTLAI